MPAINLRKALYDELIMLGLKPTEVVNERIEKYIEEVKKTEN